MKKLGFKAPFFPASCSSSCSHRSTISHAYRVSSSTNPALFSLMMDSSTRDSSDPRVGCSKDDSEVKVTNRVQKRQKQREQKKKQKKEQKQKQKQKEDPIDDIVEKIRQLRREAESRPPPKLIFIDPYKPSEYKDKMWKQFEDRYPALFNHNEAAKESSETHS